jgi:hypothetical protein
MVQVPNQHVYPFVKKKKKVNPPRIEEIKKSYWELKSEKGPYKLFHLLMISLMHYSYC